MGVEVTVNRAPVDVSFVCPFCEEENEIDYSELVGILGDPPDWNGQKIDCEHCEKEIQIDSQDWE